MIAAASWEQQKYFLSPDCAGLPEAVKDEIRILCVLMAQKLACTFMIGFDDTGDVFFQTLPQRDAFAFDEIGADLELRRLSKTKRQLLLGLKAWFLAKSQGIEECDS